MLEVLKKCIADGLYGSYKDIKDKDKVIFEFHYVGEDIINLKTNDKADIKEGVDAEIDNEEYNRKHFDGTLKKVGGNLYTVSRIYGNTVKNFEFSFVREDGKWVENTIILK